MNKAALLLIPGTACDQRVWKYQIKHLSATFDIHVADLTGATTVDSIVEKAIAGMPTRFHIAGHSLGGWVCLEILKKYPTRIKKVCLLATSADLDEPNVKNLRIARINQAKTGHFEPIAHELTELFTHKNAVKQKAFEIFNQNRELFITQQQAVLKRASNLENLSLITHPTMVLVGRQDNVFFSSSQQIAHLIPHAKLIIIENCGHMLTLEQPRKTTKYMKKWFMSKS